VTNTKTGKFSVLLSRPKHTTEIIIMRREGEIVLIYREDKPAAFGRIEAIEFDVKKAGIRSLFYCSPYHPDSHMDPS